MLILTVKQKKMNTKNILSTIIVIFLFVANAIAQGDIITADQFNDLKKNNKELVIIDASKSKLYTKSHIAGAINIPYAKLNQKEGAVKGLLKSAEELAAFLGEKGVSDQNEIVIYDEGSQKYSTRVYWILKYLGAPNVKLLHKENNAWRNARIKLTSAVPSVKATTFTATLNENMAADLAYIKANLDNIVLIDARTEKEYLGTEDSEKKYSKGHLPGAIHLDFTEVENEDKSFMSTTAFEKIITENGFTADKTYVMYCKTGVKASVTYTFFKEVLGFENVKLYDGAYLEWEAQGEAIEQ